MIRGRGRCAKSEKQIGLHLKCQNIFGLYTLSLRRLFLAIPAKAGIQLPPSIWIDELDPDFRRGGDLMRRVAISFQATPRQPAGTSRLSCFRFTGRAF
jgi:hypothetical protein